MKGLLFLLLLIGCKSTARLDIKNATAPISFAPLKFTNGTYPILTLSDTFKVTDNLFFSVDVKRFLNK